MAAGWGVLGTTHALDVPLQFSFTQHTGAGASFYSCSGMQLHVNVVSSAALAVTAASFRSCTSLGESGHCAVTAVPTGLPWTVTGSTTSNIQIHGLRLDLRFDTLFPGGSPICFFETQAPTVTGTLSGGTWDAAEHQVTFANDSGLFVHSGAGTFVSTVSGSLRDTTQTLTLN
jgi:hypothetical protein